MATTTTDDEYVIIMYPLPIFTQLSQMCTNSVSLIKGNADEDVVKDVLSCLSTRSANSHAYSHAALQVARRSNFANSRARKREVGPPFEKEKGRRRTERGGGLSLIHI